MGTLFRATPRVAGFREALRRVNASTPPSRGGQAPGQCPVPTGAGKGGLGDLGPTAPSQPGTHIPRHNYRLKTMRKTGLVRPALVEGEH